MLSKSHYHPVNINVVLSELVLVRYAKCKNRPYDFIETLYGFQPFE